jgi:hypothetical protein
MAPKKGKEEAPPVAAKEEETVAEEPGDLKEGEFIFQDGATYSGSYLKKGDDIVMHGEGLLQSGPEVFQGTFEKGQYKEGTFKSCNGAIYTGHFLENKFHGLGEYTWNAKMLDERTYTGMWKDGYMHGNGQFMNFSFGVHKNFRGFSFRGRFSSAREEQEQLKRSFLSEYCGECEKSATSAFKDLAEKTSPEIPGSYLVPREPDQEAAEAPPEKPESVEERQMIEELVSGPFPSSTAVAAPALQAFAARLADDAEKPLRVMVLEDKELSQCLSDRLRREQLQYVGQAVELEAPDAEVGAVRIAVLLNTSKSYDINAAKWKLVHIEEVQAPG